MVAKGETLLSASAVKLYGRVIAGLAVDLNAAREELGANGFLRAQLDPARHQKAKPQLAHIYGFSYQGRYTPLTRPAIFLVHGDGDPASANSKLLSPSSVPLPHSADRSGVCAKEWEFSSDVMVWEYDRGDFSLRLDIDSGPLERILIEAEEGGDDRMPYFGNRIVRRRGPGD